MTKYILFLVIASFVNLTAQQNPGARQVSLSHSDAAQSSDVFALFNNPAGLAQMSWREIGVYYSPSPFGFNELANGFIAYHEPFNFGSLGIGAMTYGFELYRENKIAIAYSYNVSNTIFLGAAFNLHTLSIKNYGNDNSFYLNFGGLYYLSNIFRLGFYIHNINRATFGNEKDNIPMIFNSGISCDITSDFTFNLAVEKDVRYNYSLCGGLEYNILENISVRSGFSNEPSAYSAGLGIKYSYFTLDYAFFTHSELGITHQAGLLISFDLTGQRAEMIRKYLGRE